MNPADVAAGGRVGAIELLKPTDATAGFMLSSAAGWNQTLEDWKWHLSAGQGYGVRAAENRLIATAVALPYPPNFGWVSMVLVDEPFRRRGLAKALLAVAAEHLLAAKLVPMLDATPAGKLVYADHGFREIETIIRWRGTGEGYHTGVAPAASLSPMLPIDHRAFGADRSRLLLAIVRRVGSTVVAEDGGFAIVRPGRVASHIGPVISPRPEVALRLMARAIEQTAGPIVVDVPNACRPVGEMLLERRFATERSLTRMAYRRGIGYGDATLVSAIAGPDLG